MEAKCEDCRFYAPTAGPSVGGYCRRYPPVLLTAAQANGVAPDIRTGYWPMVAPSAWCGEFAVASAEG
jgi:hypothetical protein